MRLLPQLAEVEVEQVEAGADRIRITARTRSGPPVACQTVITDRQLAPVNTKRKELATRLLTGRCESCGHVDEVEVHHLATLVASFTLTCTATELHRSSSGRAAPQVTPREATMSPWSAESWRNTASPPANAARPGSARG